MMQPIEAGMRTPHKTALAAGAQIHSGSDPARWWMLPVILIGSFLSFLDFFIVNIALPAIQTDLRATPGELQFVVAAYGVGFGVTLITGGRLGDIIGRKRMFMLGIAGFTLASLLCGIAPTAEYLIAARILQAVTAATVTPQVLAIIRTEFPPIERPTAIGLYGTSMGLASIMGQVFGGFLVASDLFGWSWRLIFLVNLPVGLVALVLAAGMVPESRGDSRPTLDWGGVGLATTALFLLIYPVVAGRQAGWPPWSFAMLACVAPVLAAFVVYERRMVRAAKTPLIALHLLTVGVIRLGLVTSAAFFLGLGVFFVVMTVTLQAGFGYSAFQTGLLFMPFAVAFSLASATSGRVTERLGPRILNLGTGLMAVGLLVLLMACGAGLPLGWVAAALAIYGVGQGLTQPALINIVIGGSGVGANDTGSAVGLFLTTAQSCIAFGVAAIGDVFFARLGAIPVMADYLTALSVTLWCNLALLLATFLLALRLPSGRNPRPATTANP
jgi:EmrB/QacA subfamily drug resistance transporter